MKRLIAVAVLIMACAAFLPACSEIDQASATPSTSLPKSSSTSGNHSQNEGKEIYADKLISFSFISVQDMPNMDGMFLLNVKVQNKLNQKISVYPKDASVNGHMVQLMSGTPCDIMPGKSAIHSFSGTNSTAGISKANEIKNIELKLWITDESTKTLENTKEIKIIS